MLIDYVGVSSDRKRDLKPEAYIFEEFGDCLALTVEDNVSFFDVQLRKLFGFSYPTEYISVLTHTGSEIGILTSPEGLNERSSQLVRKYLERAYFEPQIKRVSSIRERFGTLNWSVVTDRGTFCFTTRSLRETAIRPDDDRLIVIDTGGNRYRVDIPKLDGASKKILSGHI